MNNEEKAKRLGENRRELFSRLMEARAKLVGWYRKQFKNPLYQFEDKRLVSDEGELALQWQVRDFPDSPISPRNQQTSVGSVYLVNLGMPEKIE